MVNSKRCSWEECKRNFRIPEKVVCVSRVNARNHAWKKATYSRKYAGTLCFMEWPSLTRQPGNVFKEVNTRQSEIVIHFQKFCDLIIQKTQTVSLEISRDFKHCLGFEVRHRRPGAHGTCLIGNVFNSLPAWLTESVTKGCSEKLSSKPPWRIWYSFANAKQF